MKPRTVLMTIEVQTDAPLSVLKDKRYIQAALEDYFMAYLIAVQQITASVQQPVKTKGKSKG